LLSFFLLFIVSEGSQLYGVYTSARSSTIVLQVVSVDMETGEFTNITEVEAFYGGSRTFYGISAFDVANNIYYFTNDYPTPLLFAIDVVNEINLPITDLYAQFIYCLTVNQKTHESIVAYLQDNSTKIAAISYPTGTIRMLSSEFPYTIRSITYDGQQNQLLILTYTETNTMALVTMDPQTGQLGNPVHVTGQTNQIRANSIFYNQQMGKVVCGGDSTELEGGILFIDPVTGDATSQYPVASVDNAIGAWSLDQSDNWMWFSTSSNQLIAWDTSKNNQTVDLQLISTLTSIEVVPS